MSAQFTFPLVTQLAALVQRDFPTYLGKFVLNGVQLSETFQCYDIVQLWPQNWPALLIYEREDVLVGASEHTFQQVIPLLFRVQLSETDRSIASQKMRAYLGALALLLGFYDWQEHAYDLQTPLPIPSTLSQLSTVTGLTTGVTAQVTRMYATKLTYDEFGLRNGSFMMRGTCHAVIQMEEGE